MEGGRRPQRPSQPPQQAPAPVDNSLPFDLDPEQVDKFKHRLMRTKTIRQPSLDDGSGITSDGHQRMQKVLTTFDLISLGVGSCCGTGMFVVAGLVAKYAAGPATIFSFLIAAVASILSGVCYGEFGVRVPKTSGSAYMYSYVTVGEFVAFLIGWNLILEYMIGSAAGASAISACFDAIFNHSMSTALEANVGTVIGKTYPDFLGFFIGLGMTAILSAGVQKSVKFNNILNGVNFGVWVLIIIVGFCYADSNNWSNFAPYGTSGVFSGAATCFYAFIGFDIIATTGEEAKDASRSIPKAILISLGICLTAYLSVTVVLTLMVPYWDIHGDSALIDMFVQRGAGGMKFVVALGALAALTVSLLGSMFPMPRVIYAMSRDGLLFGQLSNIHPKTGTPLLATVITGTLASFMSLLVGLQILVEMMSIGTLLAYTLVSVSVLILRYQPAAVDLPIPMAHRLDPIDEDSLTPTSDECSGIMHKKAKRKDDEHLISPSGSDLHGPPYGSLPFNVPHAVESKVATFQRHFKMWWLRMGFATDDMVPNENTAKTTIIFTGFLGISELMTCMMIVLGSDRLWHAEPWAILLLLGCLALVVGCFVVILRQPQNKKKVDFMAPAVPFLPALAMFFNIYLMLKLPALTWVRLGVWICLGMLMYFGFSMWNSVKERKAKGQEMVTKDHQTNTQTAMEQHSNTFIDKYDTGTGLSNGTVATNDPWAPIPATEPVPQQPTYNADASGQYQGYDGGQEGYKSYGDSGQAHQGYDDSFQARGVGAGAEFPDAQEPMSGEGRGGGGGGSKLWFEKPAENDPWQGYQ